MSEDERRAAGVSVNANFAARKYTTKFNKLFGHENPQLKLDAAQKIIDDRKDALILREKNIKKIKNLDNLIADVISRDPNSTDIIKILKKDREALAATINNTTIVKKDGDINNENKNYQTSKPVRQLSINEAYLFSH